MAEKNKNVLSFNGDFILVIDYVRMQVTLVGSWPSERVFSTRSINTGPFLFKLFLLRYKGGAGPAKARCSGLPD